MDAPAVIELKAFVPAKDFELSKRFYTDLGFTQRSEGGGVASFACGHCAFLLQDFYVQEFAENCVMHLLVADVAAWHRSVRASGLAERYGVTVTALADQPWGITEFVVIDPAGVCWHIGQNTPGFGAAGKAD